MDGVDYALVELASDRLKTLRSGTTPYPEELRKRLLRAIKPDTRYTVDEIARLDIELGHRFAAVATTVIENAGLSLRRVDAIGSHGQTLRHQPDGEFRYSWQIGNAATIAARTGVTTVSEFRSLDVAAGGEGAPLVPPFHAWAFASDNAHRVIVNIGGIANITVIPARSRCATVGFDTGPGNCLMDEWCQRHLGQAFDQDGAWAAQGNVDAALLAALSDHEFLEQSPPKSTGRELFSLDYLESRLTPSAPEPVDVQATLARFTVESIARAVEREVVDASANVEIFVCGGGANNRFLMQCLDDRFETINVATTASIGMSPDYVEASAFAWLAARRIAGYATPLTTGAEGDARILGVIHEPRAG